MLFFTIANKYLINLAKNSEEATITVYKFKIGFLYISINYILFTIYSLLNQNVFSCVFVYHELFYLFFCINFKKIYFLGVI
jgi:hypothetical protein